MITQKLLFAPGCALKIHEPALADQALAYLSGRLGIEKTHDICCKKDPRFDEDTMLITVCSGCQKRFLELYPKSSSRSFWEVLDEDPSFPFPDYHGVSMSVQDACPTKNNTSVHRAVRSLLSKMNITVVEDAQNGLSSVCCGDSLYPSQPIHSVNARMRERAQGMPCDDIVVYCVSCIKSVHIGGKQPQFLLSLLFGEKTQPGVYETEAWHKQLEQYQAAH